MEKRKETIDVVARRDAVWVNVFPDEGTIAIVQEDTFGETEAVQVELCDIRNLISALEEAETVLSDSENVCPTE